MKKMFVYKYKNVQIDACTPFMKMSRSSQAPCSVGLSLYNIRAIRHCQAIE